MTADALTESRARLPDWAPLLFVGPLEPLGAGVWTPKGEASDAQISDQFKANAGDYHARYAASDHFQILFQQAINQASMTVAAAPTILDLGSGSGVNSIVPCLRLFPGARAVATDLSAELLAMLAGYLTDQQAADSVVCVVMDAMGPQVQAQQFDLVTGAAILHHLVHPANALVAAARALKPGGQAIFFEPFDGYGVIRLAYERILAEADLRKEPLLPAVRGALQAIAGDIAARTLPDPTAPGFTEMDDKWLFSREWIETAAREVGFAKVQFVPHNDHKTLYRDVSEVQIRLATGQEGLKLPAWALAILDGVDAALPPPVKRLLMLEATIVLTKAG
jgi:ubiquinone/menaquinone biosynthesis C-methylase UbiE